MNLYTSSTAQGGGGSFKNRKPIGEFLKGKKHFQDVIVTSFKGHCPLRPVSCASPRWTKEIEHHILVQIIWIRVPKVMAYLNCRYPGKHCILNHFELLGLFPHQRNKGLPVNLWITFQHISATQIPLPLPGLADSMKACNGMILSCSPDLRRAHQHSDLQLVETRTKTYSTLCKEKTYDD